MKGEDVGLIINFFDRFYKIDDEKKIKIENMIENMTEEEYDDLLKAIISFLEDIKNENQKFITDIKILRNKLDEFEEKISFFMDEYNKDIFKVNY